MIIETRAEPGFPRTPFTLSVIVLTRPTAAHVPPGQGEAPHWLPGRRGGRGGARSDSRSLGGRLHTPDSEGASGRRRPSFTTRRMRSSPILTLQLHPPPHPPTPPPLCAVYTSCISSGEMGWGWGRGAGRNGPNHFSPRLGATSGKEALGGETWRLSRRLGFRRTRSRRRRFYFIYLFRILFYSQIHHFLNEISAQSVELNLVLPWDSIKKAMS